jgi:hypothetical protein
MAPLEETMNRCEHHWRPVPVEAEHAHGQRQCDRCGITEVQYISCLGDSGVTDIVDGGNPAHDSVAYLAAPYPLPATEGIIWH